MMSARNAQRHLKGLAPVGVRASVLATDNSAAHPSQSRAKRPRISRPNLNTHPVSRMLVQDAAPTGSSQDMSGAVRGVDEPISLPEGLDLSSPVPEVYLQVPEGTVDAAVAAAEQAACRAWAGRTRATVEEVVDEDSMDEDSLGEEESEDEAGETESGEEEFEAISEWDRIMEDVQREIAKTSGAPFRVLSMTVPMILMVRFSHV